MKVGLAIEFFNPHRGGAEHWTYQFARRLTARGHEVHVVAQEFAAQDEPFPIVAHPLGRVRPRFRLAGAAEEMLRTLSLDVIHDMGVGWYCDLFESHDGSRFAQWEQKLQVLPPGVRGIKRQMIRVLPRYREFRKLLARQYGNPNRLMLALSKMVARDLEHYHAVRPEQIRQIYNGVDTERFSPEQRQHYRTSTRRQLGVGDGEMLLLFVGHDFLRKGLATAIRAVGRMTRQRLPVRMVVVGKMGHARYRHLARKHGAGEAVTFAGSVTDPIPYYAAADVYVLPTVYDPCSLGVLEAAASGLPSVTTRFNGAGELLSDGVDGYVLPEPTDDRAVAQRLSLLLEPARREAMGQAARRLALDHTMDRNCDEILAVYEEIASAKGRGRPFLAA